MTYNYSLSDLAFEKINERFSFGLYGEFKVIIMTKNGYINATKMCRLDGSKRFRNWLRSAQSKCLIDEVEKQLAQNRASSPAFIKESELGMKFIRGTYVHPLLIPHIASWCGPNFAIKVSQIVNNFLVREHLDIIAEKNGEISVLKQDMKRLLENSDKLLVFAEDTKNTLDITEKKLDKVHDNLLETHIKLDEVQEELVDTSGRLDVVQDKLGIAVEDRVPPLEIPQKTEGLIVMKMFNPTDDQYGYYIIKGQSKNNTSAYKRHMKANPKSKILLKIEPQPNPRNMYLRIKRELTDNAIFHGSWFDIEIRSQSKKKIKEPISEEELVNKINEINREKLHV